jgi:hypothetical protein
MHNDCRHYVLMNLAVAGRKLRKWAGVLGLAATIAAAAWMIDSGLDPLWRWSLLMPAFLSILCILEAWTGTCVVLAALGAWQMGCGTQRVPDRGLESTLRKRAWKLIGAALGMALALTCMTCLCCRQGPESGNTTQAEAESP